MVTEVVDGRVDTAADALNIYQRSADFLNGEPIRSEEQQQLDHTTNTCSSAPHQMDQHWWFGMQRIRIPWHYGVLT
eukprot:scaffold1386_cov77-Cyclotella_meneghiniana.AAC.6